MLTCAPKWPSSAMAVISVPQPGHFIDKHCSWSPGPIAIDGEERSTCHPSEIQETQPLERDARRRSSSYWRMGQKCGQRPRVGETRLMKQPKRRDQKRKPALPEEEGRDRSGV